MIELIEKKSYALRLKEVSTLAEDPVKLLEFISEQVKLGYLAGYYKFNGLTHDLKQPSGDLKKWHEIYHDLDQHLIGPDSLLPSLYSQSKGFE